MQTQRMRTAPAGIPQHVIERASDSSQESEKKRMNTDLGFHFLGANRVFTSPQYQLR
jgi:hypothetical protein